LLAGNASHIRVRLVTREGFVVDPQPDCQSAFDVDP
jgi:hypothetical protein